MSLENPLHLHATTQANLFTEGKADRKEVQAEPPKQLTKGQIFKNQLKNDLGWIPKMIGIPMTGLVNLAKSIKPAIKDLKNKDQAKTENQSQWEKQDGQFQTHKQNIEKLVQELPTEFRESAKAYFLSPEKKTMPFSLQKLQYNTELKASDGERSISHVITQLTNERDSMITLDREIKKLNQEFDKIEKRSPGKIASKVIRSCLLSIAAPVGTVVLGLMVAPILPLWGALAVMNSVSVATREKTLDGRETGIEGFVQKKLQRNSLEL